MKTLYVIASLLFLPIVATSQISGIDTSNYPIIRAYGGGPIFNNAKATDFNVVENGQSMNATLTVQCSTVVRDPSVSVVLVLDKSESMLTPVGNGLKRIDWIKQGAKTFVQALNFNGQTQVAVISFNGEAYIECGFQSAAAPVIAAIDNITVAGGATRYDPPLIDPDKGAITLLKTRPPWIKRMIVFLTDGLPNIPPSQSVIVNQLLAEKIILHAIFVTSEISNELSTIAFQSGGKSFKANTQDLINLYYRQIAEQNPTDVTYCWLSWQSPTVCSDAARNRTVQITHRPTNSRQTFSYLAPSRAVAGIALSTTELPPFPDIAPGANATQTCKITAINAPTVVTDASVFPAGNFTVSDWGGSPPPFPLAQNQSRTITITFTQTAPRDVRNAQITILGLPCSSPPMKVTSGAATVSIVNPNGGETFSLCDSIIVKWTGVDPTDRVILHYNDDNSLIWKVLATNVTGMKYVWKYPPLTTVGKVRIAALTPRTDYSEPIVVSGAGKDNVAAASVHSTGSLLYFTGSFDKNSTVGFPPNAKTGPATIASPRTEEAFIAQSAFGVVRWAISGAIFLQPFLPFTYSRGTSISINEQSGEAIAVGELYHQQNGKNSVWLGQFKTNGSVRWLKEISSYADIRARRIGIDKLTGYYYLEGVYTGDFTQTLADGKNIYLTSKNPTTYLLLFDGNGKIMHLQDSSYIKPSPPLRDSIGNSYDFGSFGTTLRCADTTLSTKGLTDGYIRKFGRVLSPSDESNSFFSVIQPLISFKQNIVIVGSSNIGISKDSTFEELLCNTRKVPATIRSISFSGSDSTDFAIISPALPIEIPADSCIAVTIRMTPPRVGNLSAQMRAIGDCVEAKIEIAGIGTQQEAKITNFDWGKKRMLTNNSGSIYLENKGTTPLTINSIALKNLPESNFISVFQQTPYILAAGATDTIPVNFVPQDTLQHINYITVNCAELQQPIIGLLSGDGSLPKIQSKGFNFGQTDVGAASLAIGRIYLHNPSTTSVTAVKKIEIASNPGDFTFTVNTLQRFDIPENSSDSSVVTIRFIPIARGRRTAVVKIFSDAAPGPNTDPTVEDTVHIVGYGSLIERLATTPPNFDIVSSCDNPIRNIIITNPDTMLDGFITRLEITGIDKDFFSLLPVDTVIAAAKSISLPIQFHPDENRSYKADLHFYDGSNQEYTIPLEATAQSIDILYEITPQKIQYKPGDSITLHIIASTSSKAIPTTQAITINIAANNKVITFGHIAQSSPAWNWTSTIKDDTCAYIGLPATGNQQMPMGELLVLRYPAFLGETAVNPISLIIKTDAPCIIPQTNGASLEIQDVCFTNARFVHIGKQYYLGTVYPQPSGDEITIPIGIGLSGRATVKIVDQLGRIVLHVTDEIISEGGYELTTSIVQLPSGIYSVIYSSGQFSANTPLIINK